MPADLAFNTAASFTTNTNWQAYSGESTMSYLTQMAGLAWHNFISAAVGIGIALALARGITYRLQAGAAKTLGNFWVDLVRATVYVLIPISIPVALLLVSQGVIQNFSSYVEVTTLEGVKQTLAMGPVASQEIIKELGHQWRRIFQRQQRPSVRKPDSADQLHRNAADFRHSSGDDLHVRPHGAGPETGLGALRRDGGDFFRRRVGCVLLAKRKAIRSCAAWRWIKAQATGRERSPLRYRQLGAVCHGHHGNLVRRGQFDAR